MASEPGSDWPDFDGYEPLDEMKLEIRVLAVLPGDGRICCNISHTSLTNERGDMKDYTALSYAWGKPSEMIPITVNGQEIMLRRTVWALLKVLRERANGEAFHVWLDILCINQRNAQEKSSQVSRMDLIFNRAQKSVAWLGESDVLTDEGFNFLDQVSTCVGPDGDPSQMDLEGIRRFRDTNAFNLARYAAGLKTLFSRDYWNRIWIMQELMFGVAKENMMLLCGSRSHPIGNVLHLTMLRKSVSRQTSFLQEVFPDSFTQHDRISVSIHTRFTMFNSGGLLRMPLFGVLMLTPDCKCSDPRDHIYGLLILCMFDRELIKIDYSASTLEVFEAALHVMTKDGCDGATLDILAELWFRMKLGNLQQNLQVLSHSRLCKVYSLRLKVWYSGLTVGQDESESGTGPASEPVKYCFRLAEDEQGGPWFIFRYDTRSQQFVYEDVGWVNSPQDRSQFGAGLPKISVLTHDCPFPAIQFELELATDPESELMRSKGYELLDKELGLKPSLGALIYLFELFRGWESEIERRRAVMIPNPFL